MTRLDTETTTPGPRTARGPAEIGPIPTLIRVPRVATPRARGRSARPAPSTLRARPLGTSSRRPRRRLRPGIRRAAISTAILAAMAGLLAIGWSPREGALPRLALPSGAATVEVASADEGISPVLGSPSDDPDLGAPVAEAEPPVVFPGYLLPDNHRDREEPTNEGS